MSAGARRIVKVCGLTRAEDAAWAIACGADWLGYIVAAGGPREIGPDGMAAIVATLPAATVNVAVLADVGPDAALALGRRAHASRLQLHRCDTAAWPADFPLPCAFVTSVDTEGHAQPALAPEPHLVQLDTAHATLSGGTGQVFPWASARALCGSRPFLLAGGLGPDNVAEAIRVATPYGVDASSRLETAPGIKDRELVLAFVRAARDAFGAQLGD